VVVMSIVRLCDCPSCHGYDGYDAIITSNSVDVKEDYEVIGGRDICRPCLTGEYGCTYWQVRVLPQPSQLSLMMQDIWSPLIYKQLQAGILLRDWDKYTQNRVEQVKGSKKGTTVKFTVYQTRED
jgi:hypothetical protein